MRGRAEASLCPPASTSDDRPHGNAGLISGWIHERSEALCVPLLKCMRFLQLTTAQTIDVGTR